MNFWKYLPRSSLTFLARESFSHGFKYVIAKPDSCNLDPDERPGWERESLSKKDEKKETSDDRYVD